MGKKRKFAGLLLSSFMLVASVPAFAASDLSVKEAKVIYQSKEIKDINKLLERAKNGISDIDEATSSFDSEVIKHDKSGVKTEKIKTYKTTQKLSVEQLPNGDTVESFSTVAIASISGDGSQYGTKDDDSLGVKAYSTIYWDYVYNGSGARYMKNKGVDGGWKISDSQLRVTNPIVRIGVTGIGLDNSNVQKSIDCIPSQLTYSFPAPSNWQAVKTAVSHKVGATIFATIKDTSNQTWSLVLHNQDTWQRD